MSLALALLLHKSGQSSSFLRLGRAQSELCCHSGIHPLSARLGVELSVSETSQVRDEQRFVSGPDFSRAEETSIKWALETA
jgi:hypothetical protein